MGDKPVAAGKSSIDLIDKEKTFSAIDVIPNSCFLDLACGVGRYSLEIAKKIGENGTVFAIDLWKEGVDVLNQEADSQGLKNIRAMVADISSKLPLEDNSIDACLMSTILHDLAKSDQISPLKEVARVLKPDGILNIIEFKKVEKGPGPPIKIRMDEKEIDALVIPCGFTKMVSMDIGEYNYLVRYKKHLS